jgi:hypothetical protein
MSIIDAHINIKLQTLRVDPDTASGHIRQEQGIRNDYQNRAPFELLQNAIDRADKLIVLKLCSHSKTFSVSNDGQPFSYIKKDNETRSDFAALCAVNTSNKIAGQSIGNKGIGFRSIWQFCKKVKIESRWHDNPEKNDGFRLYFPFNEDCLKSWSNQELAAKIREGMNNLLGNEKGKAPSFYFPEYIPQTEPLELNLVTSITLEASPYTQLTPPLAH